MSKFLKINLMDEMKKKGMYEYCVSEFGDS